MAVGLVVFPCPVAAEIYMLEGIFKIRVQLLTTGLGSSAHPRASRQAVSFSFFGKSVAASVTGLRLRVTFFGGNDYVG